MKIEKRLPTWIVGGLCLGSALMTSALTGCATAHRSNDETAVKIAKLESRLRLAHAKIDTLQERNWVLKKRIKIVQENDGVDPQVAASPLEAFKPGVQLDVPISPSVRAPDNSSVAVRRREDVSLTPRRSRTSIPRTLPMKLATKSMEVQGEQADRVLARTVLELLKSGDEVEAERTASLLGKSYPDSELIPETRFQQGLHFFRQKKLREADRLFQATLKAPNGHVRARAGAALMRGIIARRAAEEATAQKRGAAIVSANVAFSRKSFEYVRSQFPGSPEAKRASRELRTMQVAKATRATRAK